MKKKKKIIYVFICVFCIIICVSRFTFGENEINHKIAFTANIGENWDVFIMDDNGANLIQLTKTPIDERSLAICPDRKWVVYSNTKGNFWLITTDGTLKTSALMPEGPCNNPCWTHDGKAVLFTSYEFTKDGEDADLWSYNKETNSIGKIIWQMGVQDFPNISINKQIVYSTGLTSSVLDFKMEVIQQLWITDINTGKSRQLLMTNSNDIQPSWSPDGKVIVFSSNQKENYDIWIIQPDGTGLKQLTNDPAADTYPTWSPDGKEIAFVSTRSGYKEIWIKNIETGKTRKLEPFPGKKVECQSPHWR